MDICTEIVGIVPKDSKYEGMLKVFDACEKAGVDCPEEVREYFCLDDYSSSYVPPRDGMELDLEEIVKKTGDEEYEDGAVYDIDISALPENVKSIKVKVCYC